ncbi:serine-rich adhesin for platelets-like [Hyperolius riggenbachi]|uniref:serine-rich adhesin for platelets-like n=1 Tax=Hyperolius riggenbachi TaxID=752182 RepID=UPI0035A3D084
MADNLVLHVSNIPSALYEDDLVKDKLLMHFLRRSNGGNGEISIQYPTEEDGVALLTFDREEVAQRVLSRSHVLEINQHFYPLEVELPEVKRLEAKRLEVERLEMKPLELKSLEFTMPARTNLSLQNDSDTAEVKKVQEEDSELPIQDADSYMTLMDQENSEEHNLKKYVSRKEDHRQKAHQNDRSSSTINQNTSARMADQSSECASDGGRNGRPGKRSPLTSNARPASGSRNLAFTITKPAEGLSAQSIQQEDTVTKTSPSQRKLKDTQAVDLNACKRNPKYTTEDDLPSSSKHPKNICSDITSETSDQRKYKEPVTSSSNPASFTETSQSSSRSTTDNCSRPIHSRNNPGQNILVTELFVDSTVLTYIRSFKKRIIDNILSRAHAQMNLEICDGVNKVVLTTKSADLQEQFNEGAKEISDIFLEYQHCLQAQNIYLSDVSEPHKQQLNKRLQLYLNRHEIWTTAIKNYLYLIGPSKAVTEFMAKWKAMEGNITNFLLLVREEDAPYSTHHQGVGMDNLKFSTNCIVNEDKTMDSDSPSANNKRPDYNSGLSSDPAVTRGNASGDFISKSGNVKDTLRVNTSTGKSTPRNQAAVYRNSSPEHPKDTTADDFTSKPHTSVDLSMKQTSSSSSMGASRSSSQSYTPNLSAPKHSINNLDQIPLSTEFLVDSSVLYYVTSFRKHEIDKILNQGYVEMRTEPGDEFTNIVLVAESSNYPERFYKTAREISCIFSEHEHLLRHEKITLSHTSERQKEYIIRMLQSYLSRHHIWSSVGENIVHLIGPSGNILEFKEKWRANREDMLTFLRFVTERESRDPHLVEGITSLHLSTPRNDLTHDGQGHMARPASSSLKPGTGTSGVNPQPNATCNKTLPSKQSY